MSLPTVTDLAKLLVSRMLPQGGVAIDATAGNGHDTLFLAEQVGEHGMVYAFDVQETAIRATQDRLDGAGLGSQVKVFHCGHEDMRRMIPRIHRGRVHAIMFNLGYLPGGDKSIATRAETTFQALEISVDLLAPLGVLTVVLYPGHAGGREEAAAVESWAAQLPRQLYDVYTYRPHNTPRIAPRLLAVSRRDRPVPVASPEPLQLA